MLLATASRDNASRIPLYESMEVGILDEATQANSEQDTLPYGPGILEEHA